MCHAVTGIYCHMYRYAYTHYTGNLSPGVHLFQFINFALLVPPFFFHSASSLTHIIIFNNIITGMSSNKTSRSFNTATGRVFLST